MTIKDALAAIYKQAIKYHTWPEPINGSLILEEASDQDKAKLTLALLESMQEPSIWTIRQVKELIND